MKNHLILAVIPFCVALGGCEAVPETTNEPTRAEPPPTQTHTIPAYTSLPVTSIIPPEIRLLAKNTVRLLFIAIKELRDLRH